MSHKLVSVIIPTYNRGDLVANAIRSVLAQTYPAVQIIVADDGSTDDTAEIVRQFDGVEYYFQENKGQGASRNLGLIHARGDYIASLDSDDEWNPDFLAVTVDALERYDADFVFANWTETDGSSTQEGCLRNSGCHLKGAPDGDWFILGPEECRDLVLDACPAPSSALLIRRTSLPSRWNEEMDIGDDWYLLVDIAVSKPSRAAFTHSVHWTKRIQSDNIYHGRDKVEVLRALCIHDEGIMLRDFDGKLTEKEKSLFRSRMAVHQLNLGRLTWRVRGHFSPAVRSIAAAFRFAPLGSLSYLTYLALNSLEYRTGIDLRRERAEYGTR